jgi:hypothetical protein
MFHSCQTSTLNEAESPATLLPRKEDHLIYSLNLYEGRIDTVEGKVTLFIDKGLQNSTVFLKAE